METAPLVDKEKEANQFINILSVVIPIVVGLLLGIRQKIDLGGWTTYLPHVNAIINTGTSGLLLMGLYFIRRHNVPAHQRVMTMAFWLGAAFLVNYVVYHVSNESTRFGGEGLIRSIYFFLLTTHIGLSIVVLWFVLRGYYFAITKQFELHKKITRWAWPIWFYVSTTGVVVYLMIRPYYRH
jgi:putative membrane protein